MATNFFIVGDYGWVRDLHDTDLVFDALDKVKGEAIPGSAEDGEFFVTVGDNLYPLVADAPTEEEFEEMIAIFDRPHIQDLKVHAVRGNHDCMFDWKKEIELTEKYERWEMPSLFYKKEFEVGKNGEKMGLLMVDSCLMLCSDWSYAGDSGGHMLLTEEHHRLRDVVCSEQPALRIEGNAQFKWLNETMIEWEKDEKMLWKGTVLHHPMWGKWYPDFANIVANYMPLLQQHNFDVYLNGHEHVLSYAYYPYSEVPEPVVLQSHDYLMADRLKEYNCQSGQESFFGRDEDRSVTWTKGDALHQVTTGTSGYDEYLLCLARPSMGNFMYAQNIYHGWTQIHVDEYELKIQQRGVDPDTKEVLDLYTVTIINNANEETEYIV